MLIVGKSDKDVHDPGGRISATPGIANEERGNSASAIHRDWIVFVLESIVALAILTPAKRVVW